MPRSDMYAIPGKHTSLDYMNRSTCERYGEHQGDPYEQTDINGQLWECWTCCADETLLADE